MDIKWISVPALALCLASTVALKTKAQPLPAAAASQYQDHDDRWDRPPDEYHEAQRRGFHEGVEAARRDFAEHRHADADDHEIYKHPPVDDHARGDFRDGFREGYHRAMDHLRHDRDHDEMPHF